MFLELITIIVVGVATTMIYLHYQSNKKTLSKISTHKPMHIHSPLIESAWLSQHIGKSVFLKLDAVQPSGSFKIRGIGHLIQRIVNGEVDPPNPKLDKQNNSIKNEIDPIYDTINPIINKKTNQISKPKITHLISTSGANAGMAVAYCAYKMKLKCTIFLPDTNQDHKNIVIPKFKSFGSKIEFKGSNWNECDNIAQEFALKNENVAYIPMFDHECIFRGHSTIIPELKSIDKYKPDCIVVATGGGGLLSGIALGLLQIGWQYDIKIVAAQCENCTLFDSAIKNKMKSIDINIIDSEGHSLGVRSICDKAMFWAERFSFFENEILSIIVKDENILQMCIDFANEHHIMVEPLCAVALAAVYQNKQLFKQFNKICIVVCGGNHCSIKSFDKWKERINLLKFNNHSNLSKNQTEIPTLLDRESYGIVHQQESSDDTEINENLQILNQSHQQTKTNNDNNIVDSDSDDSVRESVSFSDH